MSSRTSIVLSTAAHCGCSVKVCVVGLHCCGDLSPAVLSLFASCVHPALSVLVLVSCCYHRLSVSDTGSQACCSISATKQERGSMPGSSYAKYSNLVCCRGRPAVQQLPSEQASAQRAGLSLPAQCVCTETGSARD